MPEFNTASLLFRRNRIGGVSVGGYTPQAAHAACKEKVGRLTGSCQGDDAEVYGRIVSPPFKFLT